MVPLSLSFDLGRDTTRIKDPADAARQTATAAALLARMFHASGEERCELQLLADEVGMGKTFVALGVAWSTLEHLRGPVRDVDDDLKGCIPKVLIVAPQNRELTVKWQQEVMEFAKRCARPVSSTTTTTPTTPTTPTWFTAKTCLRLDELVVELRQGAASVVVTNTQALSARFQHYDVKKRFLLGVLFRHWGNGFNYDQRDRLLKGAPADWPQNHRDLTSLTDLEQTQVLFAEEELLQAVRDVDSDDDRVKKVLEVCREIAEPFKRDRSELFKKVEVALIAVYRAAVGRLLTQQLPLVVVDEAHNWKNGPSQGSNNYGLFRDLLAPRCRRALLLTATPFQLRPDEMLALLEVSDSLSPARTAKASADRRDHLKQQRERVVAAALRNSTAQSKQMWKAWHQLSPRLKPGDLERCWHSSGIVAARARLRKLANDAEALDIAALDRVVLPAVAGFDPEVRELLRESLRLYAYNADLSAELGRFVMRHRRLTAHRRFGVGGGYGFDHARADGHMLHASAGLDVKGEGELPHYLLMRCVSEMHRDAKQEKRRSSLGSALTGCYSTLLASAEGKNVQKALGSSPLGADYLALLLESVDKKNDPLHPKMKAVVDRVLDVWRRGEKSLLFCMRTNTAHRLREIIDDRIRAELDERKKTLLGGPSSLKTLRGRLTGRDRDLVTLGLDRVLWSAFWALSTSGEPVVDPVLLEVIDADIDALLPVAARHGIDLAAERVDRVFVHRALEHIVAQRLLPAVEAGGFRAVLEHVAKPEWVSHPYGISGDDVDDDDGDDSASFDERGVHRAYPLRAHPTALAQIEPPRRELLKGVANGPSLWLGREPANTALGFAEGLRRPSLEVVHRIHETLWKLLESDAAPRWEQRLLVFQALRRALLRESVLLRLLPARAELEEARWGELLVDAFFQALPGQSESMAARIWIFLEDLLTASGEIDGDLGSRRAALFAATKLRDQQFVALIDGSSKPEVRSRVFAGFNTPLLPEVLVCTSVGQEGIDLHRHCRHVIHYDLAWNPAVIEQRTGRVDRIGSKTFRERERRYVTLHEAPRLEIGVPFLAGTYDERMYEELRLRAQTFEVLTGGDFSSSDGMTDNPEGNDEVDGAEGVGFDLKLVPLPPAMVQDLRVNLHVWSPTVS